MIKAEKIVKKWRANDCVPTSLKNIVAHVFIIIDDNVLKYHFITCENVIANEAINFQKLNGISIKSLNK